MTKYLILSSKLPLTMGRPPYGDLDFCHLEFVAGSHKKQKKKKEKRLYIMQNRGSDCSEKGELNQNLIQEAFILILTPSLIYPFQTIGIKLRISTSTSTWFMRKIKWTTCQKVFCPALSLVFFSRWVVSSILGYRV